MITDINHSGIVVPDLAHPVIQITFSRTLLI